MKEIAGNLRRDVKDLLGESANIVTGIFKDGLCTVRGAANRWRNFTRNISGAFVSLFKSTNEALLPDLSPEQQPIVTVMESMDENLPVGARMTLSEAETRIGELNQSYWDSDEPERPVRVAIDYMLDGEVDRYWLPLRTGPGCGSLLEQMECHVDAHLNRPEEAARLFEDAPTGLRELLHEQFAPQLHDDLEKLAGRVLTFFQQHHTITKLEQQFQAQADHKPQGLLCGMYHVQFSHLQEGAPQGCCALIGGAADLISQLFDAGLAVLRLVFLPLHGLSSYCKFTAANRIWTAM